jgi:hypothetical protein
MGLPWRRLHNYYANLGQQVAPYDGDPMWDHGYVSPKYPNQTPSLAQQQQNREGTYGYVNPEGLTKVEWLRLLEAIRRGERPV